MRLEGAPGSLASENGINPWITTGRFLPGADFSIGVSDAISLRVGPGLSVASTELEFMPAVVQYYRLKDRLAR